MKTTQIGLIGYGNVGKGVLDYFLTADKELVRNYQIVSVGVNRDGIRSVSTSTRNKGRIPKFTLNPLEDIVKNPEIDIVIDAVGGSAEYDRSSLQFIEGGLRNKKHVITCNKQNIARNLKSLTNLADENKVNLRYEAAVCGGIPIIREMREYFANDEITKIVGIINGTSNYILTNMAKGMDREQAIKEAQEKGYAEADPTSDLNGKDAAAKLAILASLAFRTHIGIDAIRTEGIERLTSADIFFMKQLEERTGKYHALKQIGTAQKTEKGVELSVHPAYISESHPLFGTNDAINAITVVGKHGGVYTFKGPGAGTKPTSFAVISDVEEIGKVIRSGTVDNFSKFEEKVRVVKESMSRGYIRTTSPEHQVGVFAAKLAILADNKLDVSQVYNFPERMAQGKDKLTPDAISIEESNESDIERTLKALSSSPVVQGDVLYVREESTTF